MKYFNLLLNKDFYQLFDGDIRVYEIAENKYGFPYMTGSELATACSLFGVVDVPAGSRWVYMEAIMKQVEKDNNIQKFFAWLFDKKRYQYLININVEDINDAYIKITDACIKEINKMLYLSDKKFIVNNGIYIILDIKNDNPMQLEKKLINNGYINELVNRCSIDMTNKNYDGIVTKSRTLLEEVMVYVLEDNKISVEINGKINDYYKKVKELFNMKTGNNLDERINKLLGSLETIVNSIAELRNNNSDSHAAGSTRISISESEAKLIRDSAIVFCNYLLDRNEIHKKINIT